MRSRQALAVPAEVSKARLGHEDLREFLWPAAGDVVELSPRTLRSKPVRFKCTDPLNYSSRPCTVGVVLQAEQRPSQSAYDPAALTGWTAHSFFNGQSAWHAELQRVSSTLVISKFHSFCAVSSCSSFFAWRAAAVMFWLWKPFYDRDALLPQNKLSKNKLRLELRIAPG